MAIPPECPVITIGSQGLTITMPGGAQFQSMIPDIAPDDLQIMKSLMAQMNAALSPLLPVFRIIDAIQAINGFVGAMEEALGPPPDPTVIAAAVKEVVEKVAALAPLVPQLSVPLMILGMIDACIAALNGYLSVLERVIYQETRIAAALLKAEETGNNALLQIVACADGISFQTKNGISEGMGPVNALFTLINIFLGLIGIDPIPSLESGSEDALEMIDTLQAFVKTLQDIRATIPIP